MARDTAVVTLQNGVDNVEAIGSVVGSGAVLAGAVYIALQLAGPGVVLRTGGGLRARGRMIVVGASPDPIEVAPAQLLFGTRAIEGALTGSPLDSEETLAFSVLEGIRPSIESAPLETAAEAYDKMMRNEARFRTELLTGQ